MHVQHLPFRPDYDVTSAALMNGLVPFRPRHVFHHNPQAPSSCGFRQTPKLRLQCLDLGIVLLWGCPKHAPRQCVLMRSRFANTPVLDMSCERVHLNAKSLNGRTARHSLTSENFSNNQDYVSSGAPTVEPAERVKQRLRCSSKPCGITACYLVPFSRTSPSYTRRNRSGKSETC